MSSSTHPIDTELSPNRGSSTHSVWPRSAVGRFMIATGLLLGATALVSPHVPQRYEAVASILLRTDARSASSGVPRESFASAAIGAEDAILGSPAILDRLLDRMSADDIAELTVPEGVDIVRHAVARSAEAHGIDARWLWQEPVQDRPYLRLILADHLRAASGASGATLTLTAWSRHPAFCAQWSYALAAIYLDDRMARQQARATTAMSGAQTRVDIARVRATASQEAVQRYWDTSGLIWRLPVSVDESRVGDLSQDLDRARLGLKETQLRMLEEEIRQEAAQSDEPTSEKSVGRPATDHIDRAGKSTSRQLLQEQDQDWSKRASIVEGELAVAQDVLVGHRHKELHLEALQRAAEIDSDALAEAIIDADVLRGQQGGITPDAELVSPARSPDHAAMPTQPLIFAAGAVLALAGGSIAAWRPWRSRDVGMRQAAPERKEAPSTDPRP